MTVRRVLLDGLARDARHLRASEQDLRLCTRETTPSSGFLHLAADALNWCTVSGAGAGDGQYLGRLGYPG